jgi:hypothetical protein
MNKELTVCGRFAANAGAPFAGIVVVGGLAALAAFDNL